jgi:hypothetical protein
MRSCLHFRSSSECGGTINLVYVIKPLGNNEGNQPAAILIRSASSSTSPDPSLKPP